MSTTGKEKYYDEILYCRRAITRCETQLNINYGLIKTAKEDMYSIRAAKAKLETVIENLETLNTQAFVQFDSINNWHGTEYKNADTTITVYIKNEWDIYRKNVENMMERLVEEEGRLENKIEQLEYEVTSLKYQISDYTTTINNYMRAS